MPPCEACMLRFSGLLMEVMGHWWQKSVGKGLHFNRQSTWQNKFKGADCFKTENSALLGHKSIAYHCFAFHVTHCFPALDTLQFYLIKPHFIRSWKLRRVTWRSLSRRQTTVYGGAGTKWIFEKPLSLAFWLVALKRSLDSSNPLSSPKQINKALVRVV